MKQERGSQERGAWVTMHREGGHQEWHVVFPAFRNGVRMGTQVHSCHGDKQEAVATARQLRA